MNGQPDECSPNGCLFIIIEFTLYSHPLDEQTTIILASLPDFSVPAFH